MEMWVTQGNCTEDHSQLRAVRLKIKVLVDEMRGKASHLQKIITCGQK